MATLTMRLKVPYRRVMVLWDDITGDGTWQSAEKLVTPTRCLSVGWLVKENPGYIVMAGSVSRNDDGTWNVADTNAIHRGAIVELVFEDRRRRLKAPQPEPKGGPPSDNAAA